MGGGIARVCKVAEGGGGWCFIEGVRGHTACLVMAYSFITMLGIVTSYNQNSFDITRQHIIFWWNNNEFNSN